MARVSKGRALALQQARQAVEAREGQRGAAVISRREEETVFGEGQPEKSGRGTRGGARVSTHISTGRKLMCMELVRSGYTHQQAAKQCGMNSATVSRLMKDERLADLADDGVAERTKKALGRGFYDLADRAVAKASEDARLDKASAYQLAGIAGLSFDKGRLHDGLSTENVSLRGVVEHHKDELGKVRQLREAIEAEVMTKVRGKR